MTPDELFCSVCIHHTKINRNIGCLYITDTGKPRGCPPGEKCTVREIGPTANRSKIYSVIDPDARKKKREEDKQRNEMIAYRGEALKRMRIKE